MKTFKKVLSVVIAIAMLTGVFTMMASALIPTTSVDLFVSTDSATYAKGDIITITVSEQVAASVGDMWIGGTYPIGYDPAVLEPISLADTKAPEDHNFAALVDGYDSSISGVNFTDDITTGNGVDITPYGAAIAMIVGDDSTNIDLTSKTAIFTFQMKVKDDAVEGDTTIGFVPGALDMDYLYVNDATNGGLYPSEFGNDKFDLGTCTFTIGAAGPKVAYYKAQLKMTPTSATTVADDFQFRVQSVITDADFDAYFANSADKTADKNAIKSMGIVAYKGAGTFDEATAKALVIDGTAATDYAAAETDYLSKASDTADGYFGAIIKAKHSTMPNDVTYMGFVKYVDAAGADQVIFYETTKTAALASNYDNYVSAYLAANPYSA
jgi:hypothetical protein